MTDDTLGCGLEYAGGALFGLAKNDVARLEEQQSQNHHEEGYRQQQDAEAELRRKPLADMG